MCSGAIVELQRGCRAVLPVAIKTHIKSFLERLQVHSLRLALREQGLWDLHERLAQIVPDLSRQYSACEIALPHLTLKVRGMHAFQVALAKAAMTTTSVSSEPLSVVDVGDSAGSHTQYLQTLHKDRALKCLSINIDAEAVRRIRERGLQAEQIRAEEMARRGIRADVVISFEMLEHLENPIRFLRSLSYHSTCQILVITVPYVERSRVGLQYIRHGLRKSCTAETTHVFELCPGDWRLLFRHAGWRVQQERLYLQYPRHGFFRLMKPLWRSLDFEGFWGAVLVTDHTWSDLYTESK